MIEGRAPLLLAVLAVLVSVSSRADTLVNVERDGVVLPGSQVCRFQAGDRDDPFRRWLGSQDLTCVAAGSSLTFPPGLWNVFGRDDGGVVSTTSLLVDGGAAPEALTLPAGAAARLVVSLPSGEGGVVYDPQRVIAFPVPADGRVTVPADAELWLFLVVKSSPVAAVVIAPVPAGSERTLAAPVAETGSAILTWIEIPENDRVALRRAHGAAPPHLRLITDHDTPVELRPPLDRLHGSFVLVHGLAAKKASLELGGRGWLTDHHNLTIAAEPLTVARDPLVARATCRLAVNWSTHDDLRELDRSLGSCDAPPPAPLFTLTLASCIRSTHTGEDFDPGSCQTFRREALVPEATFGVVTAEELAPGHYRAELVFGKLPPISLETDVAPLEQQSVWLTERYDTAYGNLTRGGKPLPDDTGMRFPDGGVGFSVAGTGEYHAVLLRLLSRPDARIDVAACRTDLRAYVLTDAPMVRSGRLDIDIPDNELTVRVTDTFTRAPVDDASLRFVVMSLRMPHRPVVSRVLKGGKGSATRSGDDDAVGRFVISMVPERELQLSVSAPGYQKQNVDPFSITKSEKKTIDVELVPLGGSRGRIVSQGLFDSGLIFWYAPDGRERGHAELAQDGTFYYDGAHASDETMTVISLSHPLWVTRAPDVERGHSMELHFPDAAPRRNAEVSIPDVVRVVPTLVGVVIGGLRVPTPALTQYLALRGNRSGPVLNLRGVRPLLIPDLLESGPIDLVLGPPVAELPRQAEGIDIMALPSFSSAPRKRLDASGRVAFDAK